MGYQAVDVPDGTHLGMPSASLTFIVSADDGVEAAADVGQLPLARPQRVILGGLHVRASHVRQRRGQAGVQLAVHPLAARALFGVPAAELSVDDFDGSAVLGAVAQLGVPFDILTHPRHLPAILRAVQATPGLHAILDHISKPDMTGPLDPGWLEGIAALAAVPGLHCKVSGLVTEAGTDWSADRIRPFVAAVAAAFGPDRLVFGSDWPVCTLAARHDEVVALAQALLGEIFSAEELQRIFETNGLRFYGLA